jgi:hypothetical protein
MAGFEWEKPVLRAAVRLEVSSNRRYDPLTITYIFQP